MKKQPQEGPEPQVEHRWTDGTFQSRVVFGQGMNLVHESLTHGHDHGSS